MISRYRINEIKDRNIDELIGICRGVLADGKVSEDESKFLLKWIKNHFDYQELKEYPLNTIYDRLRKVLADGILDEDESIEIKDVLQRFTGDIPIVEQVKSMSSTLPLSTPLPDVKVDGSVFCLTGAFTIGTRKTCENIIKELGGTIKKKPTLDTDYLVIGILGNDDWIHSSYGRKIEKAVTLRDSKKTNIKIITEEHFIKFI